MGDPEILLSKTSPETGGLRPPASRGRFWVQFDFDRISLKNACLPRPASAAPEPQLMHPEPQLTYGVCLNNRGCRRSETHGRDTREAKISPNLAGLPLAGQ